MILNKIKNDVELCKVFKVFEGYIVVKGVDFNIC